MIEKTYDDVKDDPGFLFIESDGIIENWFMKNTGHESWTDTCRRMSTEEGTCCKYFWDYRTQQQGILFDDPKQKMEFILRCK